MPFDVYVFSVLDAPFDVERDTIIAVVAERDVFAAALVLAMLGGGPVECMNVVPAGSDLDVEGAIFFDCQMLTDGTFVYSVPVATAALS